MSGIKSSIITLTHEDHAQSSDMVEIKPIRMDEAGKLHRTFDGSARTQNHAKICDDGELHLCDNPRYVPGAYENLQHHQADAFISGLGLALKEGKTYLIPLALIGDVTHYAGNQSIQSEDPYAQPLMAQLLQNASDAAQGTDATHISINIR